METSAWPEGVARHILAETDSTNAEAARMAATGATGPAWIMAKRQTAGRGRQGRGWSMEEGNLAASYLTRTRATPAEAATCFVQAAGLAVADLCAPAGGITLKWPNDVLVNGRKVAGILIENLGPGPDGALSVIVGIGINLRHAPPPEVQRWPATSLAAEGAVPPSPETALAILADRLSHWLAVPVEIRHGAWRDRLHGLGQRIEARLPNNTLTGVFDGVDADGSLVLRTPTGQRRIAAADVFFAE
ncbi:MAG: biotin--[acetyl-CoA-carboxylase] ligase [Pseudomonadota bacterium]